MNDPYVYNNTNILINKLDIKDQKVLDENLEAKYQTINGYNLKKYVHNYHFKKKK